MIGGMIWPPVEATASMAPASVASNPDRRISGIVTTPVATTLETALPEIVPKSEDATIATLAGPPR